VVYFAQWTRQSIPAELSPEDGGQHQVFNPVFVEYAHTATSPIILRGESEPLRNQRFAETWDSSVVSPNAPPLALSRNNVVYVSVESILLLMARKTDGWFKLFVVSVSSTA
jgi:hypothetical protein